MCVSALLVVCTSAIIVVCVCVCVCVCVVCVLCVFVYVSALLLVFSALQRCVFSPSELVCAFAYSVCVPQHCRLCLHLHC